MDFKRHHANLPICQQGTGVGCPFQGMPVPTLSIAFRALPYSSDLVELMSFGDPYTETLVLTLRNRSEWEVRTLAVDHTLPGCGSCSKARPAPLSSVGWPLISGPLGSSWERLPLHRYGNWGSDKQVSHYYNELCYGRWLRKGYYFGSCFLSSIGLESHRLKPSLMTFLEVESPTGTGLHLVGYTGVPEFMSV